MKKLMALLLLCFSAILVMAQKESGTVYSKHSTIDKTRELWSAFVRCDKDKFCSFFADSVSVVQNSVKSTYKNKDFGGYIDFWKRLEKLKVEDEPGTSPDAILYKAGDMWVEDWLVLTGRDNQTGINIRFPVHNMYRFNKEGKIITLIEYYDKDIPNEIFRSLNTTENGKVYINHPYIITVRKMINAVSDGDTEGYLSFFTEDAQFWECSMPFGTSLTKDQERKLNTSFNSHCKNVTFKQEGYPDCIYYAKDNAYVVMSWWVCSWDDTKDKKQYTVPLLLIHSFNADGKATAEASYYSTNHVLK